MIALGNLVASIVDTMREADVPNDIVHGFLDRLDRLNAMTLYGEVACVMGDIVDVIRGKSVAEAEDLLRFIPKSASEPVAKVLKSAKSNAINNDEMLEDRLVVTAAYVDAGPTLKRLIPRARGSANIIKKRTSHITIIVGERAATGRGR